MLPMLLLSDDILLMAKDFDAMNKLLETLEHFYDENSLTVNVS